MGVETTWDVTGVIGGEVVYYEHIYMGIPCQINPKQGEIYMTVFDFDEIWCWFMITNV